MTLSENWAQWTGSDADWDSQLLDFPNYCVYQTTKWGRHRSGFGWNVHKLVKNGSNSCRAQILTKKILGTTIAWIPGGPIGSCDQLDRTFDKQILKLTGARRLYVRLNMLEPESSDSRSDLLSLGWKKLKYPFTTGISLTYSLNLSEAERRDLLSPNWSRNLRRGESRNLPPYVWINYNAAEIIDIYEEMADYKDLAAGADVPTAETVDSIIKHLDGCLRVIRCDDEHGNPLAIRGALLFGSKAWDVFAAVTPQGRKQYSSYATTWHLLSSCSVSGISSYDFSGIDPIKNKGVYDFKHGTGAREIIYIGEWDRGTPFVIQPLVGRLIRYRKRS